MGGWGGASATKSAQTAGLSPEGRKNRTEQKRKEKKRKEKKRKGKKRKEKKRKEKKRKEKKRKGKERKGKERKEKSRKGKKRKVYAVRCHNQSLCTLKQPQSPGGRSKSSTTGKPTSSIIARSDSSTTGKVEAQHIYILGFFKLPLKVLIPAAQLLVGLTGLRHVGTGAPGQLRHLLGVALLNLTQRRAQLHCPLLLSLGNQTRRCYKRWGVLGGVG